MESITSSWECKWCPYEDKAAPQTKMEGGVGYVTNDSFKFGDYTGLNEEGAYLIGNMEYSSRDEESGYMDAEIYDIGLDSREVGAKTGKQGKVDVDLQYRELPKFNSDTAKTPYQGRDNQTLPLNWDFASGTQGMTELANALHQVDLYTQRRTFLLAADYYQTKSLSYGLSFQRDTKEGFRSSGMALGNTFGSARSAILATPVDNITDQGEAKVSYVKQRWQTALSYKFSNFKNDVESIRWQNAFSVPTGVTEGRGGQEPDNTMQQLTLSGSYLFGQSTLASALLSYGLLEQNDDFLPYTINGSLSPQPLQRTSLDGKVNVISANLAVNSRLTDNLDIEAQYRQNEQDNDTPQATYDYVIADTSVSTQQETNTPYSFRQQEILVEGRYRMKKPHKFGVGYKYETYDRTFQEVETTEENSLYGTYRNTVSKKWNWFLRLEATGRDGDEYTQVPSITPAQNDLLRKYNMADRTRRKAVFSVSYVPQTKWQLSFFADYANDDYENSVIGLTESQQTNYSLDFQYNFNKAVTLNIDYTITDIASKQAGSEAYDIPDWFADNDDQINVAHLGLIYHIIQNKFKLGFDYSYADSTGDISVSTGVPYPTLTSTRNTFKIYGDYNLSERSVLHVQYRYEDYSESNWAIDGVAPDSINNVLTMGEVSPNYNIGVFDVSFRYSF
ncbi:MtrB/PioB family decaheme-associated outer membrane protein [Kaarinaea lacus]